VLALSLPVPLITASYGVAAAGTFLVVQRLSLLPSAVVASGVGDVLHVEIVEAFAAGGGAARALLGRAALRLLGAAVIVFVPAAALAPWILPSFLGPSWDSAAALFVALAPWSAANLVVSPLSRVLAVSHHKHLKLVYDIVALVALVWAILFGARAGWGLTTTVAFVGALQATAYALYFALIRSACPASPAR
jgi:O-antigen/teichoic acid export membrane protein